MTTLVWMSRDACRGEDPWLFFPIGGSEPSMRQIEQARAIRRRCPVLTICLRYATERTGTASGEQPPTTSAARGNRGPGGMPRAA